MLHATVRLVPGRIVRSSGRVRVTLADPRFVVPGSSRCPSDPGGDFGLKIASALACRAILAGSVPSDMRVVSAYSSRVTSLNDTQYFETTTSRICVAHLLRLAAVHECAIVAYCLMPDHAHVLLEGASPHSTTLSCFVGWKQQTGRIARARLGIRLWQKSLYDRVLRSEDSSLAVAAYVVSNPVRAGLAASIRDYPWVGSTVFAMESLVSIEFSSTPTTI